MPTPVPRIQKPYYRNGPQHRAGADVSFADINKVFGFKTVIVGKWVEGVEQQLAANLFFDALCDLMEILQVPEHVISLNGSLSLAFGVGGQKHSCAHYDVQKRQLALAKNAGGGALAHEWFHAFDHYISTKMFATAQSLTFASSLWLQDAQMHSHPLNQRLADWFKHLFLSEQLSEPSDYVQRCALADKTLKHYYFAQPQEMAARAFEAAIQDNALKNAFLVQGTKQTAEAKVGIYPQAQHRQQSYALLMNYFLILGKAVNSLDK
ncbi:CLCA_X family protein [Aliiglaciecola litoralis]|uniref:Large polyvalent protein-associated domain-containing protein n=1 Tax=Aliiglaciecola litoralis TaxID=582857 RepID=A0ABN1LDW5_9ALTE